ncbi:TetR/AcrR family transcriptional regulator [Orrella sp. JC864]|uniref:TetR/AcrR family transcriptional regulator n=1 Tax=Orrella sp. JC864 TaxID=3120298 RepID=UPI00300A2AD6
MHVFWRQGYETTTVQDLTAAMGITAPSLYAAFGDKEGLYMAAVAYYRARYGEHGRQILDSVPQARAAVRALLEYMAYNMCDPELPSGCMVINSAVNCTAASSHVQEAVADCRAEGVAWLQARIERGVREGDVPAGTDCAALAAFYFAVASGMSLQARDGADCATMHAIIESAMAAWPAAPGKPRPGPARESP